MVTRMRWLMMSEHRCSWCDDKPKAVEPAARECESKRYASAQVCEDDGPIWDVVYRTSVTREIIDQHPACFRHGLVEQDRHVRSGGIADCTLEKPA